MLTRDQLARIAHRNHIGLGAQERDYIQHLFLSLFYAKTQDFVFKGGTALRVAYNYARYSEDLDFNSLLSSVKVNDLLTGTVRELGNFGIKAQFRNLHVFKENTDRGVSGDISFEGPLYTGKSGSKGKVRVDVSLRGEAGETKKVVVAPKYDDVSQFVLTAFTLDEIFAEKARALFIRGKPRDLYDVWVLLESGIKINRPLIDKKLALYKQTFDFRVFKKRVEESERDWEIDLQGLMPQTIPFNAAKNAVIADFER